MKIKPWSHVQVVNDGNDEATEGEYVFQLDELVDLYGVASSTEFKENSNFYIIKNTYVYVDFDKLNDLLSISGHTKIDEDEEINRPASVQWTRW